MDESRELDIKAQRRAERIRAHEAMDRRYAGEHESNETNMRRMASFVEGTEVMLAGSPLTFDAWLLTCVGMPNGPRLSKTVTLTWEQAENLVRAAYNNGKRAA